jgi:hypothetical protein
VVIWRHSQQIKIYGFQEKFEVALNPVGKVYITSAILSNALTGMYGNTTSTFLELCLQLYKNIYMKIINKKENAILI